MTKLQVREYYGLGICEGGGGNTNKPWPQLSNIIYVCGTFIVRAKQAKYTYFYRKHCQRFLFDFLTDNWRVLNDEYFLLVLRTRERESLCTVSLPKMPLILTILKSRRLLRYPFEPVHKAVVTSLGNWITPSYMIHCTGGELYSKQIECDVISFTRGNHSWLLIEALLNYFPPFKR